jgi:hypothetical protein
MLTVDAANGASTASACSDQPWPSYLGIPYRSEWSHTERCTALGNSLTTCGLTRFLARNPNININSDDKGGD